MTHPDPLLINIRTRAWAANVRLGDLMKRAGFRGSTWSGWMRGRDPALGSVRAVEVALDALIAEKTIPLSATSPANRTGCSADETPTDAPPPASVGNSITGEPS